ncbi:MAG TPA: hypothetical protein PLR88_08275 [Bacteroidales bacterium]|nr:hypothetical protein [Bacteroidales bacterium]
MYWEGSNGDSKLLVFIQEDMTESPLLPSTPSHTASLSFRRGTK